MIPEQTLITPYDVHLCMKNIIHTWRHMIKWQTADHWPVKIKQIKSVKKWMKR